MAVNPHDIDQIRQLATQLTVRADAIEEEVSQITTGLRAVNWTSPDAENFKSEWMGTHLPRLSAAVTAMRSAATTADQDAGAKTKHTPANS